MQSSNAKGSSGTFIGVSETGHFEEAINAAVDQAKQALHSESIMWRLVEIGGIYGGFTDVKRLSVTIQAEIPPKA